jgi:superfamily II DNA or RNA helicase
MKIRYRDYQTDDLQQTKLSLQEGINRQLLVWSTGLGKTYFSTGIHKEIYPGEPTLFIVNAIELAKQTRDSFRKAVPGARIGVEMNTSYARPNDEVVVLSVDTWGRAGSKRIKKFDPDYFKKIIVDEAHTSPTDRYKRVLNYFGVSDTNLKQDRMLLGLTATPNRPDGVGLKKVFDDITANRDLIWSIQNGWLVEPVWYPIKTDVDITEVKTKGGDFDRDDLSIRINTASRNELIVKAYHEYSRGKRSVVFCASVAHAYELQQYFEAYGIPSAVISAKTPKSDRQRYIQAYHDGDLDVLLNFGTLTTGFDETEIDSIINARPMKSDLLFRQANGRGFRPSVSAMIDLCITTEQRLRAIANSQKPFCKLIDMVDIRKQHDVVGVPQLFGLHDEVQASGKRLYKDVYEPMKEAERKHGIDISELKSLDEIELKVAERERINITSLKIPTNIKKMSKNAWVDIGKDRYELSLYQDSVSLIVRGNKIERYDLFEVDLNTGIENKMNEHGFASLQGAINVADQYAERNYNTDFIDHKARWRRYGVTEKQFEQIRKCFKPEFKRGLLEIDEAREYEDTEIPHVYIHENGKKVLIKRGEAKELLGNFFTNQKKKRAKR